MENKRGWIRIIEAVIALLIITGALLVVITGGYLKRDISAQVYDTEMAILKEVSKDQTMRAEIVSAPVPTSWDEFTTPDLSAIKTKIKGRIPSYLDCQARVCALDATCEIDVTNNNKDIYARSIAITATASDYNPKQLKLFCWEKT